MATINVYLNFNGNCREAFDFYKEVFGREFSMVLTYNDMPPQEEMPPIPESEKEKIMHVSLPISEETILMGSDTSELFGSPVTMGDNFSIYITAESKEDADRYFKALSAGGIVEMPMEDVFWGSYFGSLKDKFGINWLVSFG